MHSWARKLASVPAAMLFAGFMATQVSADDYIALLSAGQAVPPQRSNAMGVFTGTYDKTTNLFHYEVTFTTLAGNETAAHLHGPAEKGQTAGVMFGIVNPGEDELGSPKFGTLGPFTVDERDMLDRGLLYINIHSDMFPAGEIRGQIYRVLRR